MADVGIDAVKIAGKKKGEKEGEERDSEKGSEKDSEKDWPTLTQKILIAARSTKHLPRFTII